MNNLKTAVMVVLLLGALYGAYQFLNQRDVSPPPEVLLQEQAGIAPPTIEFGNAGMDSGPMPIPASNSAPPLVATTEVANAGSSPATMVSPPSFAVIPSAEVPAVAATSPVAPQSPANTLPDSNPAMVAVPVAPEGAAKIQFNEPTSPPSAYAERTAKVETPAPTATNSNPHDPFTNLQSNPFYRPGKSEPSASTAASQQIARQSFERGWVEARQLVEAGKYPQALALLTVFYDSQDLTPAERQQLLRTLDSLAGRVIYSTEHYLEEPYVVRTDETLMDIAQKYNVPHQLLQNINGIRDPLVLIPRSKLKVVRGPFHADVSVSQGELALFVGKYYAGRFPISIGQEPSPAPGEYNVKGKRDGKDYYTNVGQTIPQGKPTNPYGRHWIDLGREICIHGSAEAPVPPEQGCISLAPIDAADVYGILSLGSTVTIRR